MQIDVHHIKAHITRTGGTQHRIQVSSVIVHQATSGMHQFLNLRNLLFEEPQRIGVGHHHSGNLRTMLSQQLPQRLHIHGTVAQRLHLYYFQSAYSSAGGVGSVSGIRHDNQTARLIAPALMILLDNHQTCQLAMSSGKGFQREGIQACQFAE